MNSLVKRFFGHKQEYSIAGNYHPVFVYSRRANWQFPQLFSNLLIRYLFNEATEPVLWMPLTNRHILLEQQGYIVLKKYMVNSRKVDRSFF